MRRALEVIPEPVRTRDRRAYTPNMPRGKVKSLTAKVMKARGLGAAARVIRRYLTQMEGDWLKYAGRLADGLEALGQSPSLMKTPFSVFYLKGNTKLPFASFSALPEHTCPGAGECLSWCYSFKGWRYPGTWARQVMNTLLLRFRNRVIAHKFRELDQDVILRLYVDGDFDTAQTIEFWFGLLDERPDIRAYGYSKSWRLLWEHAQTHSLPSNYWLNLSSGGADQGLSVEQMMQLPMTRGQFLSVPITYHGARGFARYDDPEYHKAVRAAAQVRGLRVFSCPGRCGECAGGKHACGSGKFKDVVIANGVH